MPRKRTPPPPDTPRPGYSAADVLAHTTATKSNLIHWTNIGIVTAGIENSAGTGYPRRFSLENLVEFEVCAAVNRFKVPATLIADAAETFRAFHHRHLAVTDHGPTDGDRFTPAQRTAYLAALSDEVQLRNKKLRLRWSKAERAQAAAALAQSLDDHPLGQRTALQDAAGWERYRRDPDFRQQYFCGLFVVPPITGYDGRLLGDSPETSGGDSHIAHTWNAPREMNWMVSWHAIVINLGPVLTRIELNTGLQL